MNDPRVLLRANDLPKVTAAEREFLDGLQEKLFSKAKVLNSAAADLDSDALDTLESIDAEILSDMEQAGIPEDVQKQVDAVSEPGTRMSSLIQTLRSKTDQANFRHAIAQVYSLLFDEEYGYSEKTIIAETRVTIPHQQFSAQRVPYDHCVPETVAVFLRAGLYPSLVVGKEIEIMTGKSPDYALFRIRRREEEGKGRDSLEYVLDYAHCDPKALQDKRVVIPEPMVATAGSLLAINKLLEEEGIKPKSLDLLVTIGALEGVILAARHVPGLQIHLAWLDPVLNEKGYILPGLGDAGDMLNGTAEDITALLKSYGDEFCKVHRNQIAAVYRAMEQSPRNF